MKRKRKDKVSEVGIDTYGGNHTEIVYTGRKNAESVNKVVMASQEKTNTARDEKERGGQRNHDEAETSCYIQRGRGKREGKVKRCDKDGDDLTKTVFRATTSHRPSR